MITTVLELLGLALVVWGVALVFVPAALVVAGVSLLWVSRSVAFSHETEVKR